ncbi:MAG: protein-glutamate O-methyltransferase CheR [Flammeovirgaceae bacterium]
MEIINNNEIIEINRAIYMRYGIDFTNYEISSLKRRISRMMHKHNTPTILDLWRKILLEKDFIQTYIQEISVGHTGLFRDPYLWKKVKKQIIPNLIHQYEEIHIWHAGCATGEEVFTMAIILEELGLLHKVRLLGTDMNSQFIVKAQQGKVLKNMLEQDTENYLRYGGRHLWDYFQPYSPDEVVLIPQMRKNIRFLTHHLNKDQMSHQFDIIFCRNVLIYFDDFLKEKVLKLFASSLRSEGWLVLGYYDMMPNSLLYLFEVEDAVERVFRKKQTE